VNQGQIPLGEAVDEQLEAMGIKPADLDYVLLTHLDCDHANGLRAVKDAKHIIVAQEELDCARKNGFIRYKKKWWKEMITSGVSLDKEMQKKSLLWIREQSMDANCIESLATHHTDIRPHMR
jgi:glyoxylase-like metal-dependent hydrolase (beta-lactamase superfamily II)